MTKNLPDLVIKISFYTLLILTPLFWSDQTYELFEFNKMMLVYFLTIVITSAWIFKSISAGKLIFSRTPLDLPLLVFLIAHLLSTIFSMDPHTSIWGYYTRSNGGLVSFICYILLYWAFVSNVAKADLRKYLLAMVIGGLLVSAWAIPEHKKTLAVSPSCVYMNSKNIYEQYAQRAADPEEVDPINPMTALSVALNNDLHPQEATQAKQILNADCWVQDVQSRVFASMGQPNWLAAYLGMIIFISLYFALTSKYLWQKIINLLIVAANYWAFTLTYSRGATLGLVFGAAVFALFYILKIFFEKSDAKTKFKTFIPIIIVILLCLAINFKFDSAFGRFNFIKEITPITAAPAAQNETKVTTTQLESGGTESGAIRLIVWQGAFDIFRHYPLLGSGVETFAYAYYQFRPMAHNLVSEWDFLYNKAHNEYLNYLATMGIVGFLSYLALILMSTITLAKILMDSLLNLEKADNNNLFVLTAAIVGGYITYLVQNLFGFSVVMIAVLFYLYPAFSFVGADLRSPFELKVLNNFLFKKRVPLLLTKLVTAGLTIILLLLLSRAYSADIAFANGSNKPDKCEYGQSYNCLLNAVNLRGDEPLFQSELAYAAAETAVGAAEKNATESARLKQSAADEMDYVLKANPKNVSWWRTAIRAYYQLSLIDPEYNQKTLDAVDSAITLAPTDAKLFFNKALILHSLEKTPEAIDVLNQCLKLKPNYREARITLGLYLHEQGKINEAKEQMNIVLQQIPNDPEVVAKLKEWDEKK